jgi:hypothetical protein
MEADCLHPQADAEDRKAAREVIEYLEAQAGLGRVGRAGRDDNAG